ncbi:MAG: N-methyl-L-tryptophan oxidase [Planctomycetes bacterium]|nr:N-methyl-L-tryptophan oxidase [Planctomycetota bacterium]
MAHDVTVIGLGAMGSAAAWQLARRGLKVLGLEQFSPGHDRGSSHGRTRVIRQAYFEHPDYVPLVLRAYELWRELEAETKSTLRVKTGGLMIGPAEGPVVRGSLESARRYGLPHRLLSHAELSREYPFMRFRPQDEALWEDEAGVVFAEDGVLAFQERARALGAELRFGVKSALPAGRTVITAGAWLPKLAPALPLKTERQVMHWFDLPQRTPLFIWDYGRIPFYSIPDVRGDGVKVAFHHGGELVPPEQIRREVGPDEIDEMKARLRETIPALAEGYRRSTTCIYTNTPDEHFAFGLLPGRSDVVVGSPCSGHGFKFAPVVGEILADLVIDGKTRHPIAPFALQRLL